MIKRRLNKKELGFGAKVADPALDQEYMHEITPQDLVEYGFETEFVGRLPVSVHLGRADRRGPSPDPCATPTTR